MGMPEWINDCMNAFECLHNRHCLQIESVLSLLSVLPVLSVMPMLSVLSVLYVLSVLSVMLMLSVLSVPASRNCAHCRSVDNQGDYEIVKAMGERVDEVVDEDVVLLKADVEGLEPGVIESAKGLLQSYKWVGCFLPSGLLQACMKPAATNYAACSVKV